MIGDVKLEITKNVLRLVGEVCVTVVCLIALMNTGLFDNGAMLQILAIHSGSILGLCGIQAYADRRSNNGNSGKIE